jgi:Tfp pilus assembly protein PilF
MMGDHGKNSGRSRIRGYISGALPIWVAAALLLTACGASSAGSEKNLEPGAAPKTAPDEPSRSRVPEASRLVRQAEERLAAGDTKSARALLEQALAEQPNDARASFDLATVLESAGELETAEKAYRDAIRLEPTFGEALNNLGLLLRSKEQFEEASAILRRAVEADPRSAVRHENLAMALEDKGELASARAEYEQTIRLGPDNAMTRANLGLLLLRLNEPDAAKRELSAALPLAAKNRPALVAIGSGLRRAGDPGAAVQALQAALAAGDGKPTAALLSELALAQRASGDRDGALATLRQVVSLDPNYATAHYLLGGMLAGAKQYADAIAHYQHYLKLEPQGTLAAQVRERINALKRSTRP